MSAPAQRPTLLALTATLLALVCSPALADSGDQPSKAPSAAPLLKSAREVHRLQWAAVQAAESIGLGDVDTLAGWSGRIMFIEVAAASPGQPMVVGNTVQLLEPAIHGLGGPPREVLIRANQDHVQRMTELERLVSSRVPAGKTTPARAAARFYRLGAEHLLAMVQREEEREIELVIPEPSEARPLALPPVQIVINVDAQGKYSVAGKVVTLDELREVLKTAHFNNPGRTAVLIRVDRRCPFRHVVAATDACSEAKIHNYRIATTENDER